ERFEPQPLHVDLFVWRIEGATFYPAVSKAGVFDQAIAIGVGRGGESIRLHDRFPVLPYEIQVAARSPIIPVSDDIQRSCVGARPGIAIVREPWYEVRALRDLVWNLSILPLELLQKV